MRCCTRWFPRHAELRSTNVLVLSSYITITCSVYCGMYFILGDYEPGVPRSVFVAQRTFRSTWAATLFQPLGWCESQLRREPLEFAVALDDQGYLSTVWYRFE